MMRGTRIAGSLNRVVEEFARMCTALTRTAGSL